MLLIVVIINFLMLLAIVVVVVYVSLKRDAYEVVLHGLLRESEQLDQSKDPCSPDFIPNTKVVCIQGYWQCVYKAIGSVYTRLLVVCILGYW